MRTASAMWTLALAAAVASQAAASSPGYSDSSPDDVVALLQQEARAHRRTAAPARDRLHLSANLSTSLLAGGRQSSLGQRSPLQPPEARSDPSPPKGSHGEEPWQLYPVGQIPGTQVQSMPAESYLRADGSGCGTPYGQTAGNYYYNVSEPTLVPYLVDKSAPNRVDAAVIVLPGGALHHLTIEVTGTDIATWLNGLGISAFILKYRVPAVNWLEIAAAPGMDVKRALSLVRERSLALGLNFKQIGLFGASSSGELVTRLTTWDDRMYPRIDAVDDMSTAVDFQLLLYPYIPEEVLVGAGKVPPTFITMASSDPCVSSNTVVKFYREMMRQGAPLSELHIYNDTKHGYGTCNYYPLFRDHGACQWRNEAERFLAAHLDIPAFDATATQMTAISGPVWCPPEDGICEPTTACVGHCRAECWSQC